MAKAPANRMLWHPGASPRNPLAWTRGASNPAEMPEGPDISFTDYEASETDYSQRRG
jgi:hypothetical protein